MTTPSGQISLNDVNVELGLAGTTTISMNQANVRTLAGVPSGQISMSNLQGKSNRVSISYTFSANTQNAALTLSSISGYSAGKSDITITVNSGVYLWSSSTGTAGLTLSGGTSGDTLTIVNNGYIMGKGGDAPPGNAGSSARVGNPGGPALSLSYPATINNTNPAAYIGGGGGSGGSPGDNGGGGGAGGGNAYGYPGNAGGGGSIGSPGANGLYGVGGGGGGRIFPGTGGIGGDNDPNTGGTACGGGGAGGGGGGSVGKYWGSGGDGGSANNVGGSGMAHGGFGGSGGGGGGGWGATGGTGKNPPNPGAYDRAGGSGGKAVALNGNSVTWTSGNTTRVYGSVS